MCKENDGHFHEDFGDEPGIEERIPEGWEEVEGDFDDSIVGFDESPFDVIDGDDDDDGDDELARDIILKRQELEDFEGFDPFERDDGGEGGW